MPKLSLKKMALFRPLCTDSITSSLRINSQKIEEKPQNQIKIKELRREKFRQAQYVQNVAKWEAARAWCKNKKLFFRVITEKDIFHQGKRK